MVFKALYLNALCLFTLQFARTSTSNQQYRSVGFIVDVGSGMSRRLAQQLEQELRTALKGNMRSFSRYALALVSRRGQMVRWFPTLVQWQNCREQSRAHCPYVFCTFQVGTCCVGLVARARTCSTTALIKAFTFFIPGL